LTFIVKGRGACTTLRALLGAEPTVCADLMRKVGVGISNPSLGSPRGASSLVPP
jgi:hypothetical protein